MRENANTQFKEYRVWDCSDTQVVSFTPSSLSAQIIAGIALPVFGSEQFSVSQDDTTSIFYLPLPKMPYILFNTGMDNLFV